MDDKSDQRHQHAGKSSKSFFNAGEVLDEIGLTNGDSFLDVGCGDGYFSLAASKIVGNEGKVYAVDNYEESIAELKVQIDQGNIANIQTIVADVTKNVPLPDGIIDVCLMANVLHGFAANAEIESCMSEIAKVIRPGGTLTIVDFKKISGSPGPPISIRLTPQKTEELVTPYGFQRKLVVDVGQYHYAVILCKASAQP
ncbi:MAG: methyltransferase domain-containing protein [Dehalococcoidia bacterium]